MDNEIKIFDDVGMADLYRNIYNRSETKKTQLDTVMSDIQKHITDKNDALMFLPQIKEFMVAGIKNDENLLKLAAVIQKTNILKAGSENGELLSEEDKEQLRKSVESTMAELEQAVNVPVNTFKS